jgi:prepilin signal peptidase PulO-like enzyme (type II secretory pathway)
VFYVLSFFFGASIGSFVQVVATRLNVAPVLTSRSKCLSCGEALRASELVPIFSYLFLMGKCKHCKVPFGMEALFVEVGFGVVFMMLYHVMLSSMTFGSAMLWLTYYTIMFVCLGVIALYDYRHSYVPVAFLMTFSFLSLVMLGMRYAYEPSNSVLLGPLVVGLPFLLIWLVTKGRALGFGDVILYMAIGAFFGIEQGLAVLLLSVWFGAIVGLLIYVDRKRRNIKSTSIPFVPFIVAAFLFVLFTDISVFSIASIFA